LRRYEDPTRSSDPRIRALVTELRSLQLAPAPRAHFRAELRAQLISVAPRLVAEGVGAERPLTHEAPAAAAAEKRTVPSAGRLRGGSTHGGAISLGRPVAIAAAVVALFAMVLGGAVLMSRGAVPGDTLYGLKRADENVQLAFTSGDTARGKKYLQFAENRAHEVSQLLSRSSALAGSGTAAASGINSHTANLVATALSSADNDVRSASRLLGDAAVESNSSGPLTVMATWAPAQVQRLQAITDRIPAGSSLRTRSAASTELVSAALSRSQNLTTLLDCHCLDKAPTDSLGPLPCVVCAPSPTVTSSDPTSGTANSTGGSAIPSGASGSSSSSTDQAPVVIGGSSSTQSRPKLPLPSFDLPPIVIPPLPLPTPSSTRSPTCVVNLLGICVEI
ncbi:MAG: hypothetical protein QOG80_1030, partial [Pseudonocardiales bacterium]|nr:hypothetical protein [Pseudonocardiales bacterium]